MAWEATERARQYLATEHGVVRRDWGGQVPIALVYPNSYAVGMSSLAIHTLYRFFNAQHGIVCERAFAWLDRPDEDAGPPLTLESQRPIGEAAVIAISVSFEMDYFHVVSLLQRAGVPLRATDRDDSAPLVLLGGPAVSANPAPLAPLADAMLIGEAEPALSSLAEALRQEAPAGRSSLLTALATLPGLYVPRHQVGRAVQRLYLEDLDAWPTASTVIAPRASFGDMHLIEIARGCQRGCRFCLAGQLYRPMRQRSIAHILQQARQGLTYHHKVGLVAAAVSDYAYIDELVTELRALGIAISVSSLRVRPLSPVLLQALQDSGAQSITLAPEAGSDALRRAMAKGVTHDDVLRAAELAAGRFAALKLYYMVGLPGETDADVDEIVTLSAEVQRVFGRQVVVNVTPFVPKAHTPLARVTVADERVIAERLRRVQSRCRSARLQFRAESAWQAQVQTVLSRGDEAVGEALLALPDSNPRHWLRDARAIGLDVDRYLAALPADEPAPWDRVIIDGERG